MEDLIRGWGIYAVTIGLILYAPSKYEITVGACLVVSIAWHLEMVCRRGQTTHHVQAIFANILALLPRVHIDKRVETNRYLQKTKLWCDEDGDQLQAAEGFLNFYKL